MAALKSGHVRGAGLDVAPREPLPPDSELWQLHNVVMTPHVSGNADTIEQIRARDLAQLIQEAERGKDIPNRVNLELGY